jgi:hypothetical protein
MHLNHKRSVMHILPLQQVIIILCSLVLSSQIACSNNRNLSSNDQQNRNRKVINSNPPTGDDYYEKNFLRYGDFDYVNNIKSVLFTRSGWEFSTPIIEFNTNESLQLHFDDLDADFKNYAYTIIHCDALWQPSQLMDFEYIEGFTEDRITQYAFSRNTRTPFTHYRLTFPNNNMQPKLSGNYIMKVFIEGDPSRVVLTRRFMVFEQRVAISATVKQATNLNHRATMQELDFVINTSAFTISNPYRDMRVVITQNGRWDNAIMGLQPRLVQGPSMIYDYEDGNLFPGGNEFRNFDTKSLRYRSLEVANIASGPQGWEVDLMPDRSRQFMRYTSKGDINGRFLIKTDDYPDDMLEADYTWVNFTLPVESQLVDGNIYVMGALTNWNMTPGNKMVYNYRDSRYELRMLFKQGFYDYLYVYLADGQDAADVARFEGSHSIAENDYTIYVYYRRPGNLFDSLIGVHHINSGM